MKIETKLKKIAELAELGVKDNLDQPCAQLFAKEKGFALSAMQIIKAELESHMKKGKWG